MAEKEVGQDIIFFILFLKIIFMYIFTVEISPFLGLTYFFYWEFLFFVTRYVVDNLKTGKA